MNDLNVLVEISRPGHPDAPAPTLEDRLEAACKAFLNPPPKTISLIQRVRGNLRNGCGWDATTNDEAIWLGDKRILAGWSWVPVIRGGENDA